LKLILLFIIWMTGNEVIVLADIICFDCIIFKHFQQWKNKIRITASFQADIHAIVDGRQNIRSSLWWNIYLITTVKIMFAWTKTLNQYTMTHQITMVLYFMQWGPRMAVWDVLHTRIIQKCFVLYVQHKCFIYTRIKHWFN